LVSTDNLTRKAERQNKYQHKQIIHKQWL